MTTTQIVWLVAGVSYVLMVAFFIGLFWKKWNCRTSSEGDDELKVGMFSIFWIVTVPVYLFWHLGNKIVDRFT